MSGKSDIVKGRIKEAAGVLAGNDKLRSRGKTDQAIGRIKQTAAKATDKVVKGLRG
ncbi:MAG: CsbD family protein [Verrucomicrobia bacterium]|nr:CsbD family protein [Verrucomicrobiota bacterium]